MAHEWIEVSIRLISKDYKENVEVYSQRLNYEFFKQAKPVMIAEIVAVVNDLTVPRYQMAPMSPDEIDLAFDKEYTLHKSQS